MITRAIITGTGHCVPDRVVTNNDLAKIMDTSDEWIQQRSGIRERRHIEDGLAPSDLGAKAALNALEAAKLTSKDIDLLLVTTLSSEHTFPGTAAFIQRKLGMQGIPAMDLRAQCSGFLYGLATADAFIKSGSYGRVLLVSAEVHSRALDFSDRGRDTAVLFGDGAGAVILEPSPNPERGIMSIKLHSDGDFAEKLWVEYPSMAQTPHVTPEIVREGGVYPKMDGKFVFKHAVTRLPEVVSEVLESLHLKPQDIDHWLFHQANLRINEHVAATLGVSVEKCPYNIDRYGNCSSASIPILLDEQVRAGNIKPWKLIGCAAFGSGFTWGGAVIRW
ncbi:MAG: beta-ketoacyl-ACP synthase III [Pseudomonadota bacterium]